MTTPEAIGLPPRLILYTFDQIATMLAVTPDYLEQRYIHFEGRSLGARHPDLFLAINIAPSGPPDWRVNEKELVRWARRKRFKIVRREL